MPVESLTAPTLIAVHLPGPLSVGVTPYRISVPFASQVLGVAFNVATPPQGANLVFDVIHGPWGAPPSSMTTLWSVNNGQNGNPDGRPTIAAGTFDEVLRTVTPSYTPGMTEWPYLALPDENMQPSTVFVGNQPSQEGFVTPIVINEVEAGSANWPQEMPTNVEGYFAGAGDVFTPVVVQVGTTEPGADAEMTLWVTVS